MQTTSKGTGQSSGVIALLLLLLRVIGGGDGEGPEADRGAAAS